MKTVLIIQRILPYYRIKLFCQLRHKLALHGISLKLIYGQEKRGTVPRTLSLDEPWSVHVENKYWSLGTQELVWQPVLKYLSGVDGIIIEQANRLLINHCLVLRRKFTKRPQIAYWGHGKNLQAKNKHSSSERLKRRLLGQADWWFAYTPLSAKVVASTGFSKDRITNVQNTIDTYEFSKAKEKTDHADIVRLKTNLGITSKNVCLYCGGIYSEKRIHFLLEACFKIKSLLPDFEMVIVGDGPDQHIIETAAKIRPWLHYVGPKHGVDRVPYFLISKALLMPGMVGLAVVDSFVAGTPLFTTDIPVHSPEIAYLVNGVNGAITPNSADAFAHAVVEYLNSEPMQVLMQRGCQESAKKYSLEIMVDNFAAGIRAWLADQKWERED
jgi:glycosyltransferase involved in cell wall biosynthesis